MAFEKKISNIKAMKEILSNIKNKEILILNDGRGLSNFGLDLGSRALIDLFKQGRNVITTISHLDLHRSVITNFDSIERKIIKKIFPSKQNGEFIPDSLDQYPDAIKAWSEKPNRSQRELLGKLSNCDVVIYNAEGSAHSNNIVAKKSLFLLYLGAKMGKMSIFMNGSITFQSDSTDKIAPVLAHVANVIDMVYLRESLSLRKVADVVGPSNCAYLPDSTFKYFELANNGVCKKNATKNYFLVSSSMSKPVGAYEPGMLPLGKLVTALSEKFGRPIFLIKDPEDFYLANFAKSKGHEIFSGNNVPQLFSLFANASFLLSGRFHHLILATINGCPVIPMDTTSSKNRGIIGMLPQLEYSKDLVNPSNILASSEFVIEQANIISNPRIRANANTALVDFSRAQHDLLINGFNL